MATIERSVSIHAPATQVFKYMDNPMNQPTITPSMTEVKDVERLPNGGTRSHYVYKMAAIPFEGTAEAIEYVHKTSALFSS